MFEFKIPESQIYLDPCGKDSKKSVIGRTIDVSQPSCRREGNILWLTTHSKQVVDLLSMTNRKVIEINLNLKKKPSEVRCTVNQANITASVTVIHELQKPQKIDLGPETIEISFDPGLIAATNWIAVACIGGAFLILIIILICIMVSRKKQDPTADDMPLHTADMTFTSETANQGQMTTYER